jgi:hypothetical protein
MPPSAAPSSRVLLPTSSSNSSLPKSGSNGALGGSGKEQQPLLFSSPARAAAVASQLLLRPQPAAPAPAPAPTAQEEEEAKGSWRSWKRGEGLQPWEMDIANSPEVQRKANVAQMCECGWRGQYMAGSGGEGRCEPAPRCWLLLLLARAWTSLRLRC